MIAPDTTSAKILAYLTSALPAGSRFMVIRETGDQCRIETNIINVDEARDFGAEALEHILSNDPRYLIKQKESVHSNPENN